MMGGGGKPVPPLNKPFLFGQTPLSFLKAGRRKTVGLAGYTWGWHSLGRAARTDESGDSIRGRMTTFQCGSSLKQWTKPGATMQSPAAEVTSNRISHGHSGACRKANMGTRPLFGERGGPLSF